MSKRRRRWHYRRRRALLKAGGVMPGAGLRFTGRLLLDAAASFRAKCVSVFRRFESALLLAVGKGLQLFGSVPKTETFVVRERRSEFNSYVYLYLDINGKTGVLSPLLNARAGDLITITRVGDGDEKQAEGAGGRGSESWRDCQRSGLGGGGAAGRGQAVQPLDSAR